jgi:hypothetical protein
LGGLVTKPTTITNVGIDVLWAGTPLHKEAHAISEKHAAGETFKYTLGWAIPSFAPTGKYHVTITVDGELNGVAPAQSIGCVTADFVL